MPKHTIRDIAKLAGVSRSTVSLVLNDSPSVNERTRQRVLDVIEEVNYHPSAQARGLVSGLTRGSSLPQLARAAVESIAYQVRDVFEAMQSSAGGALSVLMVDGGVTRNEQLMQFQADIIGVPVQRNNTAELSAMGAAYLAGLATGVWATTNEIAMLPRSVDRFAPSMGADERNRLLAGWQDAVARTTLHP